MNHSRDWCATAAFYIRSSASNGAGCGIPPNKTDPMLPNPELLVPCSSDASCRASHQPQRLPSNDSSAARKAIVTAGENICFTSDSDISGMWQWQQYGSTLPNRAPIVATGKLKILTTNVPTKIAINIPGTRCVILGPKSLI